MFCIVAFLILAVLGIFSVTSRQLAREALECVGRRVTLRPCTTGFDERIKARILGSVINRSERVARLLNRNFELFSWLFFFLMMGSTVWGARGLYLFYTTGSCSGANESAFCLLDPSGTHNRVSPLGTCPVNTPTSSGPASSGPSLAGLPLDRFPTIAGNAGTIVMIGCYGCDYSRQIYPGLRKLARATGAGFTFIEYPVKVKGDRLTRLGQCLYERDRERYWRMNDLLMSAEKRLLDDPGLVRRVAAELGLDPGETERCIAAATTKETVWRNLDDAGRTGFYGTPTVFVNERVFVGPKPYRVYAMALEGFWWWAK